MNANLRTAALVAGLFVLTGCGGDEYEGGKGPGREYEVVAEGSAAGTDPALTTGVPPLTNTSADTTTAFTVVPGDGTSTAVAPMPPVIGTDPTMTGGTYYPPTTSGSQSTMPAPRTQPQLDIRRSNPRPPSTTTGGTRPPQPEQPSTTTSTAGEQPEPVETPVREPAPVEEPEEDDEDEDADEPVTTSTSTSPG